MGEAVSGAAASQLWQGLHPAVGAALAMAARHCRQLLPTELMRMLHALGLHLHAPELIVEAKTEETAERHQQHCYWQPPRLQRWKVCDVLHHGGERRAHHHGASSQVQQQGQPRVPQDVKHDWRLIPQLLQDWSLGLPSWGEQ